MFYRSQFILLFIFLLAIVLSGLCECAIILVRLVCTPPLLFYSIALDASKQKKIVYMVRILLAWFIVECGRFRECLGNNPSRPNESNEQGGWLVLKILTECTPAVDFPLKSCILGQVGTVPVKDSLNFCWCHCFNSRLMVVFTIIKKENDNFTDAIASAASMDATPLGSSL